MVKSAESDFRRMLGLKDDEPIPEAMVRMHDGIKQWSDTLAGDTLGAPMLGYIVYACQQAVLANPTDPSSPLPEKRGPGRPRKIVTESNEPREAVYERGGMAIG